jgi:hypothetical protein
MVDMANLSARMSKITQAAGLFGFNLEMLLGEDPDKVVAEIEVRPSCPSEHEARNKAQAALMQYELTGRFPNFSEGMPQAPSPISKVRDLRKLTGCSLKEAFDAVTRADEPRFAGDVLMSLAVLRNEASAQDLSAQWRAENPALDQAFPAPHR